MKIQIILERNQRVFLAFIISALLICGLILLAIFSKARL